MFKIEMICLRGRKEMCVGKISQTTLSIRDFTGGNFQNPQVSVNDRDTPAELHLEAEECREIPRPLKVLKSFVEFCADPDSNST